MVMKKYYKVKHNGYKINNKVHGIWYVSKKPHYIYYKHTCLFFFDEKWLHL